MKATLILEGTAEEVESMLELKLKEVKALSTYEPQGQQAPPPAEPPAQEPAPEVPEPVPGDDPAPDENLPPAGQPPEGPSN